MAKNKSGNFMLDEGLSFSRDARPVASAQQAYEAPARPVSRPSVQADNLTALFSPAQTPDHRPLGTTQGRKGQKAKRINMAFSDDNHAYLMFESRRRGMSITQFVNFIIDEYKVSPDGKVD